MKRPFGIRKFSSCGRAAGLMVLVLGCNSARATLFTVDVTAANGSQRHDTLATDSIISLPNGTQQWKGTSLQPGAYFMQYDLLLDADPSVSGAIAYTNSTSGVQTVSITVSLTVAPTVPAGATAFGSSALTLADANADGTGSVLPVLGGAIYNALINTNVTHKTLFDDPAGLTVTSLGGTSISSAGFGNGTSVAASNIGIQYNFRLSAGDTVTFNSTFTVVPEPGAVNLVWAGLSILALVHIRHRKVYKRQEA